MPHPIKATKNKAGRPSGTGANAASKKLLNVAKKLLTKAADLLKHKPKKCLGGARAWSGDDLQSILLKTLKDPEKAASLKHWQSAHPASSAVTPLLRKRQWAP